MLRLRGCRFVFHIPGESAQGEELNEPVAGVEFPPFPSVVCRCRATVVVVVPFPETHEANEEVISTFIVGLVVPVTPAVGNGIHGPGGMEHEGHPEEESPEEP